MKEILENSGNGFRNRYGILKRRWGREVSVGESREAEEEKHLFVREFVGMG